MIIWGNGNIMVRIPVTMVVPEARVPADQMIRLPLNPAVDAADFIPHGEPGHAMAGKSIIAIFGEGFVADGEFRADTVPLPTKLGGVRVLLDGTAARLYLVTPGLIHAQLPMGLRGPTATLLILRDPRRRKATRRRSRSPTIHRASSRCRKTPKVKALSPSRIRPIWPCRWAQRETAVRQRRATC